MADVVKEKEESHGAKEIEISTLYSVKDGLAVPQNERPQGKNLTTGKIVAISLNIVIFLATVIGLSFILVNSPSRHAKSLPASSNDDALSYSGNFTFFCANAEFPTLCEATLNEDPRAVKETPRDVLALLAVDAAKWQVWAIQRTVGDMAENVAGNGTRRLRAVVQACESMLEEALSHLEDAAAEVAGGVYGDAPTWLSSARTFSRGCAAELDEFAPAWANETSVQAVLWQSRSGDRLLANSLSLVNSVSKEQAAAAAAQQPGNSSSSGRKLADDDVAHDDVAAASLWVPAQHASEAAFDGDAIAARGERVLQGSGGTTLYVSKDGKSQFLKIQDAVNSISSKNGNRVTIVIKAGVYKEQVTVKQKSITFLGAGMGKTVLTNGLNAHDGVSNTYTCCTLCVTGQGFVAKQMSVVNSAGEQGEQAVAMRSSSDQSAFYMVEFAGNQDTVYLHSMRSYFLGCKISGTLDFLFGNSATVFQSCTLVVKGRASRIESIIAAHGRLSPSEPTAFVFNEATVLSTAASGNAFLGRPWWPYSRMVYLNTYLPAGLGAAGWETWLGDTRNGKAYMAEYKSKGPGARAKRPSWVTPGIINSAQAAQWSAARFIAARYWVPQYGLKVVW
eukprot:jgi/Mesen1/9898/ME000070S09186